MPDDDSAVERAREQLARDLAGVSDQALKMRLAELTTHREQCCTEEQNCVVWWELTNLRWVLAHRAAAAGPEIDNGGGNDA